MAQSEVFNIKAIADFSQPEREVQRLRSRLDKEIGSAFRNMEKSFGQPLGHITGRVDDFASSLEASNARVIAFGASAGIVYQVSKAFRELVKSTIQVEKSMADIQVVLNANVKQLESYRSGIFRVAKETGQGFFEVSKAATELARQGLSAEKTLVRLKDALVLSRLSGMDTLDSVEALTAAINGFGETVINSTRLVDKFAEVDQKFAVSSQDLAEAFKRVGSTAVDAGVSIDELIALVTTAQQITARGGSVIGNSFKTIFTRVQRPQVLEDLEEAGIKVRDFSGESLKAVDILKNLANSYDNLASSQKSFVSEAVGGVFQINVLKALLKDIDGEFSVFSRALETSATASDAASKKNALLNKTLDSLINKSTENLREFAITLGELTVKPVIVKTLTAINAVVEYIIKNKEEFAGVFDTIGKFVSGPVFGLVIGSMVRLFAGFSKFALSAAAQIAGLTKRQEDVARIQNMISNILVSQPELYKRIVTGAISVQQAERETLSILRQQAAERTKMMNFASGAASHAFASGARVNTRRKNVSFPNFADPIRQAVQREVSSGIPRSAIRIAADNRLKSSNNPQGLGIYNTIDEPLGISQGINRSQRMGIDPRTHGIPNFASSKKRIYNPQTGKFESLIVDDQSGRLTDPVSGKIVGNLYFEQPSSVLDPSKSKGRDIYKENQLRIQREKSQEAARQASEAYLYSQGLRKDPLMLPAGSVGGLTRSKGKSRDRYAEYIAGKSAINLPESIAQFNESQRIADVAKKTAEDLARANKDSIARMEKILSAAQSQEAMLAGTPLTPSINALAGLPPAAVPSRRLYSKTRGSYGEIPIIGGAGPQSGLVVVPQGGMGGMQGPMLPSQIITSGPSAEEKRLRDARIKAEKEVIATRKRFSTAETGLSDRDVESGRIAVRMRSMAKEFAKEFQKVLTDPKVSRFEKQVMADVFTKELDKGRFVSTSRVIDALGEQYALKGIMSPFRGRTMSFTEDMKQSVKRTISEEIGGPTSVISGQGMMRFGKDAELLTSKYRLGTRNINPPSINELLTNPAFLNQGSYTAGRIEDITKGDKATLIRQIRKMYPNEPMRNANRMAEAFLKGDTTVIEDFGKYLRDKGVSPAIQGGQENIRILQGQRPKTSSVVGLGPKFDFSKNTRFKKTYGSTEFPTFAAAARGVRSSIGGIGGAYSRMRNMDPMNKMLLLGGIGMASSMGTSAYERSVAADDSLSGMQKKNRNLISGAVGNTLTGAMIGGSLTAGTGIGMAGGAAIGGVIAAAFSINDILKNWNDILPDLETNLQKTVTKIQQLSEASQGVSSVLFKLSNIPEFKTEKERQQFISQTEQELKLEMSRRGLSGTGRQAVFSEIGSGKPLDQIISNINKIFAKEAQAYEPSLALQDLTTGIIKAQREGQQIDFAPLIGKVRSQKGGNVSNMIDTLSEGERASIRSRLTRLGGTAQAMSSGIMPSITERRITQQGQEYFVRRDLTQEEVNYRLAREFGEILTQVGVDKTSEEFRQIMESVKAALKDGPQSFQDLASDLKEMTRVTDITGLSVEKLVSAFAKSEEQIKNFRRRDLRFMAESRNFNLGMQAISFQNQQNINRANFNKDFSILSNQASPMLGVNREISSLRLAREAERLTSGYTKSNIFNTGIYSDIEKQRTSLRSSVAGREMTGAENLSESVYNSMMSAIEKGGVDSIPELEKIISNQIDNMGLIYERTGKEAYREQINNLTALKSSLLSTSQQIEAVNTALDQNNKLSEKQEQILRQRLMMPYAQGDFLRSQSAQRNAERRALEGSDPKTEITSAMRAFREEMGYTVNDFYTDFENSARDAAQTFKSEFKSAFNDFRRGTLSAGEALRQMAMNVLDRIATNASNMAIDSLLNAAFGGASRIFSNVQARRSGGMVRKRYADGGTVVGGSGVVDDVPAMLTSGEYVINRDAVRTYGSDFFRKINQGRGATGTLENQYLFLDDQGNVSANPTRGEARISAALSNIGATNDLMRANTDRFAREQRFVSYVQARRQYDAQRTAAIKQYERGIRQQAIGAGVSAGIGIGGAALGNYFDSRQIASGGAYGVPMGNASQYSNVANSGSIVPRIGSSNRDTMGYSLTGGEAIIRKEAVNMYGPQYVNDLNNGRAKTMRFGGSNPESSIGEIRNLPSSIDRLAMSIDSLGSRSGSNDSRSSEGTITNQFSFNIEVNASNGQATASENNTNNQQQDSGVSQEDYKKIGEATKIVALQAIQENLRSGGMIYNAIRGR